MMVKNTLISPISCPGRQGALVLAPLLLKTFKRVPQVVSGLFRRQRGGIFVIKEQR